ncbi:MAG: VOC family protein, partial [Rhodothermales bacterium]
MTPALDQTHRTIGIQAPGYRLPAATRLGPVDLQVADLNRSMKYYTEVLGFRVLSQDSGTAALGASRGAGPIVVLHERPGAHPVPRRGRLGLFHVAYLLPSRADLAHFVRHLAEIGERAGMSDHLVSEAIYLTDPDGLGIEVYADRARDAWRHDGREIAMATLALNIADLMQSAGEARWNGMP